MFFNPLGEFACDDVTSESLCVFSGVALFARKNIGRGNKRRYASANACGLFGATYTTPLPSARRCGGVSLVITAHPAAWTDTPCWEPRAVPSGCWRNTQSDVM